MFYCLLLFWRFCITIMIQHFSSSNCQRAGGGERGYWIWWSDYGNVIDNFFLSFSILISSQTPFLIPHLWRQHEHRKKLWTCWEVNEAERAAKPMLLLCGVRANLAVILFIRQSLMSVTWTSVSWGQTVPTIQGLRWSARLNPGPRLKTVTNKARSEDCLLLYL